MKPKTQQYLQTYSTEPVTECCARSTSAKLTGRAVIHRQFQLVIRLTDRATGAIQPVVIKFDPGARTTGIAVARADATNPKRQHVLFTAELEHRGTQSHKQIPAIATLATSASKRSVICFSPNATHLRCRTAARQARPQPE